jgi:mannosyltransferase
MNFMSMHNRQKSMISVIIANQHDRVTGVSATIKNTVMHQVKQVNLLIWGAPVHMGETQVTWLELIKNFTNAKQSTILHCRRNHEILAALILNTLFKTRFKIIFTSAAQRPHSRFVRWLMNQCDLIIATSKQAATFFQKEVKVINHGINLSEFYPLENRIKIKQDILKKHGLKGQKLCISVGRIRPEKGTLVAIKSLIIAAQQDPLVCALLIGMTRQKDQSFQRQCQSIIDQAGLTHQIKFIGEIKHDCLLPYYNAADITLACPQYEGFGLTPLESLACATPVIATDTGYFRSFLNLNTNQSSQQGALVNVNDIHQIAHYIGTINDRCPSYRSYIQKHFSAQTEANKLIEAYLNLLNQ